VRFRHYDPTPGMCRWLERDLAGYQDGPSLYSSLGRNPMAGTDPTGQFANILGRAVVGAFIGGVAAAINGEDVLAGAAKGAVVGAVAGATFGAGLAAAGAVTASSVVAAGTVSGMAGARAAAVVYEGRAPAGQDLAWGGILGGVAAGILPAASRFGRFLGHHAAGHRLLPRRHPRPQHHPRPRRSDRVDRGRRGRCEHLPGRHYMRPYRRQHLHLNSAENRQRTEDSKTRRCSPAAFGGLPSADPTAIPTHALSEELSGTTKIISHAFAGMIPFDSRFTVCPPSGLHGSVQDDVSLRRSTT
jgi:hypothetical protein